MHYADIKKVDIANGEGVRVSLFVSGCRHHCKGCFNEIAWNFKYGKEFTEDTVNEIMKDLDHDYVEGLSLLGGEPLEPENQEALANLVTKVKEKYPNLPIEGEIQFDAAVAPRVARTKCPQSEVAGHANTFIFPDINAGNIGYKIAQRLGNFEAYGPILLGLNAPINDLSRGCNAGEVYSMAIITAALA